MHIRYFLSFLVLFALIDTSNAQKVKRKGVTPLPRTKNKKSPTVTSTYSLDQFKGKWQETMRTSRQDKVPIEFSDTILLYFMDENKVETRIASDNKMSMKGNAQIEADNTLMVAADMYTIRSVTKKEIVLDDGDKYVHHLKKTNEFWYEKLGKLSVKQDSFTTPITVALTDIMGKWLVYKRQAKPGDIPSSAVLIRYLKISEKTGDNTAKGEITIYKEEKAEDVPCTITLNGSNMLIVAGSNNFSFSVYKADSKEFVFGNADELLYYCKPL